MPSTYSSFYNVLILFIEKMMILLVKKLFLLFFQFNFVKFKYNAVISSLIYLHLHTITFFLTDIFIE